MHFFPYTFNLQILKKSYKSTHEMKLNVIFILGTYCLETKKWHISIFGSSPNKVVNAFFNNYVTIKALEFEQTNEGIKMSKTRTYKRVV